MAARKPATMTTSTRRVFGGLIALVLAAGAVVSADLTNAPTAQAVAEGLPTWDDVQQAKNNQAAAAQKVTEIQALIAQVAAEVEQTRKASEEATMKLMEAEEELRRVEERLAALEEQAAASEAEAQAATEQAAALVSQLYRSGGVDPSLDLFLEEDDTTADALLDRLARMEKATERNTTISFRAEQAMNSARSLSEQTESARVERDRLRDEAEKNRIAAAEAADAARENLIAREADQATLQAQLAALRDTTAQTVEGYETRLRLEREERERIEREAREAAEAARRAAEEAARKAAEEAAKNNSGGGGGGGGNSGETVNTSGWVRPLSYYNRVSAEWWGYYGHVGIDLAVGEGTPILAATSGTVSFSGWMAGYGNVVFINHSGGVQTRYAHMVRTPIVRYGQSVSAGQVIGYVGTTGTSTGNHLHYETLVNYSNQNPRTFMAARGVYF